MPTISLAIQKGGSGKTTTAVNLAAALQEMGQSVLLIDLDPQANLTQALGLEADIEPNIYGAFQQLGTGKYTKLEDFIQPAGGMNLIPASLELASAELDLVSVYGREHLLRRMLHQVQQQYDFCFIDCPPAIGLLTVNALVASDFVLMPLQAEFLPLRGVKSFMLHFEKIKAHLNPQLQILGFLLTKFDSRKTMNQRVLAQLSDHYGDRVFQTRIRTNIDLAKAQETGVSIFEFNRSCNGALDYLKLAHEFLGKMA